MFILKKDNLTSSLSASFRTSLMLFGLRPYTVIYYSSYIAYIIQLEIFFNLTK